MSLGIATGPSLLLILLSLGGNPDDSATSDQPPRADEIDLGTIVSARSMLDARVDDAEGVSAGKVSDVVLDVAKGQVQAVMLSNGRDRASIPANRLDWSSRDEEALRLTILPEPQGVVDAANEETQADQDAEPLLIRVASRERIPVFNGEGKQIGAIVDFGLASRGGQIAYALLELDAGEDDTLYPVPVAAFVVPKADQHWLLEIPADVLAGTPTLKKGEWPEEISRAWVEYVHVRYGRSPLGGVQRERRATE